MSQAKCPHCGEMNKDLWELWPEGFGCDTWTAEIECGFCDKPVKVRCVVTHEYTMEKS